MATMAQCLNESRDFFYSSDYIDILKDTLAFDLSSLYLESYEFFTDNDDIYSENAEIIQVDECIYESALKTFWSSLVGALKKIISVIIKPFTMIYTLFVSLFNKKEEITVDEVAHKYHNFTPENYTVMGIKVLDEKVVKNLIDILKEFKTNNIKLFNDTKNGAFDQINEDSREWIKTNVKYGRIYQFIGDILKEHFIDAEYDDFIREGFLFALTPKFLVPAFFSVFDNRKEALLRFIDVMTRTFSHKKVVNVHYTVDAISRMNAELEECKHSDKMFPLNLHQVHTLRMSYKEILNGFINLKKLLTEYISDMSNFQEYPEKREEFSQLLKETTRTMNLIQIQTAEKIKLLAYQADSVFRLRKLFNRIYPELEKINEYVKAQKGTRES